MDGNLNRDKPQAKGIIIIIFIFFGIAWVIVKCVFPKKKSKLVILTKPLSPLNILKVKTLIFFFNGKIYM